MTDRPLAIVTGAASGIGKAFAIRLAAQGYDLLLVDLDAESLKQASLQASQSGAAIDSLCGDVSDQEFWAGVIDHLESGRRPQVLINSAGLLLGGSIEQCSMDQTRRIIEVNLLGVIYGCQAVAPRLEIRGGAPLPCGVINVASIFASVTPPNFSAYNSSKAGVVALTETLGHELAHRGFVATAVLPGLTSTALFDRAEYANQDIKKNVCSYAANAELTADDVAERSLRAFAKKKPLVTIGRRATLYRMIHRFLPWLLRPLVRRKSQQALGSSGDQ